MEMSKAICKHMDNAIKSPSLFGKNYITRLCADLGIYRNLM